MMKYTSWKCDRCNLTLKAKNKTKLARLIKIHLKYHNTTTATTENNTIKSESDTTKLSP
jgi:hypothetical protein